MRALKAFARMTGFYSRKNVLRRSALWIYKNTFDDIDYESFFRVCKLPDSMHSWFLVAHLHMWLVMVRLRREGEDGQFLTKQLVEMFWEDVKQRPRALGVHSSSLIAKSMRAWSGMFSGLIVAYEEGLLLSDKILAAAIWRNLIGDKEAVSLTDLETMVCYIRSQVKHMDTIDSELLLRTGRIKLLPCTLTPIT
ncbi:Ubiquinol-cytochrome-c reductase complex assembly factor 1 [Geodia barretti]|nr:Ubiquinol-cytochrome-c reductase complex assembly factor 1 [Geodia barretti]